jgi:hypothetical protein
MMPKDAHNRAWNPADASKAFNLNIYMAGFSSVLSGISLVVSVTVAWLTLIRRGKLRMTQPVQIAFAYGKETNAKIFLRTLLYATGKRGHVIESLYLKVKQQDTTLPFAFWTYGEREALTVAGGLKITEEGVAYDHHFQKISGYSYFEEGEFQISVYARVVGKASPLRLGTFKVVLTRDGAMLMHLRRGALFTWNPETQEYDASFDERTLSAAR